MNNAKCKKGINEEKWLILYANVGGLKSKMSGVVEVLNDHDPHLFLMTETQLRSNTGTKINGYTLNSKAREEGPGGGVAILVRNDMLTNVAPHVSERNIEMVWISVRRKNEQPIFIGSYYGKQESRTSKEDIEREMSLLEEEITEMQKEGEVFIAMDGNGKLGILGEAISRNGKCLQQVFKNMALTLMNTSVKCEGKITRMSPGDANQVSAIDFIVASEHVEKCIKKMIIDEDGLAKIKGKKQSDHNTIIVSLAVVGIDRNKIVKKVGWNLKASNEKWAMFNDELNQRRQKATAIITQRNIPIDERYN